MVLMKLQAVMIDCNIARLGFWCIVFVMDHLRCQNSLINSIQMLVKHAYP